MAGHLVLILALRSIASAASSVWPLPRSQKLGAEVVKLVGRQAPFEPGGFFRLHAPDGAKAPLLQRAFPRYEAILWTNCTADSQDAFGITGFDVFVANTSEHLDLRTSEHYTLKVPSCSSGGRCRGEIRAESIFGALHGLASLAQLVEGCGVLSCAPVGIEDEPRFRWRGLMVDTARHFLADDKLRKTIDAMADSKLNVLHLHFTDVQAFSIASERFPKLSDGSFSGKAACSSPFNPLPSDGGPAFESCTHSLEELSNLVGYAKDRGVRVVPEVDTPTHTASWCVGYPELCMSCNVTSVPAPQNGTLPAAGCAGKSPQEQCKWGYFSVLDPSKELTWTVLYGLIEELGSVFEDGYFHLGFDEVHWDCYDRPHINDWMQTVGIAKGDHKGIIRWYLARLQEVVRKQGKSGVVWQEAFDHYGPAHYPPATDAPTELGMDTVVQLWFSPAWYDPPTGFAVGKTLDQIVASGRSALVSFPWYLSANVSAGPSFESLYLQDVQSNKTCKVDDKSEDVECTCFGRNGDIEDGCYEVRGADLEQVLGGEAALWGELVDDHNLQAATFMAAAVVAERLWSPRETLDVADAKRRLLLMQQTMIARGFGHTSLPPFEADKSTPIVANLFV